MGISCSLWDLLSNQNSCHIRDLSNFLKSTNVWVISSFKGSIVNLRPRFRSFSMDFVNTISDSLNTTLICCLLNVLFDVFIEEDWSPFLFWSGVGSSGLIFCSCLSLIVLLTADPLLPRLFKTLSNKNCGQERRGFQD